MKAKLKDFLKNNEAKIVLGIGLILVAIIAFEAGVLNGQNWQAAPLVIEKSGECSAGTNSPEKAQNSTREGQEPAQAASANPSTAARVNPSTVTGAGCVFVGSKNSDKYHLPTCTFAKRIKPENIVCFKSAEDAVTKGYQPDKSCVK